MNTVIIGNKNDFAFEYGLTDETRFTPLYIYINGLNVLGYKRLGNEFTAQIDTDRLVEWLRIFVNTAKNDDIPCDFPAKTSAEKYARCIEKNDELKAWGKRHRLRTACGDETLANIVFEKENDKILVSWYNTDNDELSFSCKEGCATVDDELFKMVVSKFIQRYKLDKTA